MDRPTSQYGGQSRASALRNSRSPPRRNEQYGGGVRTSSQGKPPSPLRSKVSQGMASTSHHGPVQSEDEMYELRRQEELRRQIQNKERELEAMSTKNKERVNRQSFGDAQPNYSSSLPQRSGSASGYHQAASASYKRKSNSPLRHSRDASRDGPTGAVSFARSGSAGGYNRDLVIHETGKSTITSGHSYSRQGMVASRPPIPHMDNYMGSRQRSPRSRSPPSLRKKVGSQSPIRDVDMRDASYGLITGANPRASISPVRTASNEYINQLRMDNDSLQKRLNLVLQELYRVNRDKSSLLHKSTRVRSDVDTMQRQLNSEDNADQINNDLQMDLNRTKDGNISIKRSLAETDMTRTEAIQKLRTLQAERDRRSHMVEELKDDQLKKHSLCKQIETEQYHATEKIRDLENQISALNHANMADNGQIEDIRRVTDKLTFERDELQSKLEQLNRTYDNCVSDISRERAQMQGHNRHHNKLLVAKVTFALLEQMFQRRKQEAMNEFFQYCKFDSKCHNTLKQFVKVIERLGQFRQRIAIKQWHQRTYKPMEMKVQEQDLCYEFMRKKLMCRMFNMWRNRQQNADSMYGAKNKALQAIWNAKVKDAGKDVQRAFALWKDNCAYQKLRNQRCKKLIWRAYSNALSKSWQRWLNYSKTMGSQVRLHILAKTFAESQLKRITFNEMKFVLFDMKRKRLNRLRMYVKAWKESNQYKKFILAANMSVLGFKKDCNKSMLKTCFDALKHNKEEEKFMLMSEALEGDCLPAIESVSKDIEVQTKQAVRSGRNRGLDAIKNMIYRQVGEYFFKWKGVQQRSNVMINQNLKQMIIKRFQSRLQDAFDLWKKGKGHKEITMQNMTMMEMQEEGSNLAAAVDTLDKEVKIEKAKVDRCARSSLNRGTKIMQKRYLKQYMDKWAEVNNSYKNQKDGSELLLRKMRARFCRQGFMLWKAGCAREQLADRNEGSCDQLKAALNLRLVRKCFNAVRKFNAKNTKATQYTKILFSKMDHWMKKRAFATWMDGGNTMKIEMCHEHQNNLTEEMTVKNNEIGNLSKKHADKSARVAGLTADLKKAGQRSMSNCFARAYYKRIARAFELWKESKRANSHKERLLRRTMEHWLKQNGKYMLAIFANWKCLANINDTKKNISGLEYEMNDIAITQKFENSEFEKNRASLQEMTKSTNVEFDNHMAKRSKIMALMTENNQGNHMQGRLRYIFLQWAAHTKRQRHLANCIKTVCLKSLWQRGFQNIREYSRDKGLTRGQNSKLDKVKRMFWKRNCAAAFSKWRQTEYEQALEMITMTEESCQQMTEEHMQTKKVIQKQNITRSAKIVGKLQKQKWLKAWKSVTRWLKHKRVSTANLLEAQSSYAAKRLIKKWRVRTETTLACRGAYNKFQEKRNLLYTKAVFRELMCKHHRDKALAIKLSNTAAKFDNKQIQSAFQMIRNFWIAKQNVHAHEKKISSRNIGDCLTKIYRRKLLSHYSHMRRQIHGDKVVEAKKKAMFGHFISAQVRDAFKRWKQQSDYCNTVIEVNEIGPVVEEVLDHRLDVHNLKNLMADEGFTTHQIDDISTGADKKGLELIARSVARMKHWNGTDDYLKPKMFDRWRKFVQFRKIVKHWLEYMTNRQEHQKADLSHSFNKWKFFFADKQNALQKRTRAQLMTRGVLAAKRLEVLADTTQQDEDLINHISDQNEELFTNYRKSQRLAMALGRDNLRTGMMKGFKIMMDHAHTDKKRNLEGILARNIDMIAATKDKIKELENDNECLANENEELRQFSLDGYQLGKNVQNLTCEREKLSVDLADKANTIKKLLDENERLSMRLRQAQDNASHLLRQSQVRAQ